MPTLSRLEKPQVNIRDLAMPEVVSFQKKWRPELIITQEAWNEICEEITEFIAEGNMHAACLRAGYLTVLFPERRVAIPFMSLHFQQGVDVFKASLRNSVGPNTTTRDNFIWYLTLARYAYPQQVRLVLLDNPELVAHMKRAMNKSVANNEMELAYDWAGSLTMLTGESVDISQLGECPQLRRAKKVVETEWWQDEDDMAEMMMDVESIRLFFPDEIRDLQPPVNALPQINKRLQSAGNFVDLLESTYHMSMLMADSVEVSPAGINIVFDESKDKQDVQTQPLPPTARSF